MDSFALNNNIYLINNNILFEVIEKLENILKETNNNNIIN